MALHAVLLGAILLCGFHQSLAASSTCDVYAAVGEDVVLALNYTQLGRTDLLSWTQDSVPVFVRDHRGVRIGKPQDVSLSGSLWLNNLKLSSSGLYEGKKSYANGTLLTLWSGRLCVMDKVSKPLLRYVCDHKFGFLNLSCHVATAQDLQFSWILNGFRIADARQQTLNMSLLKNADWDLTCLAENKVSARESDAVSLSACRNPPTQVLLCFASKTVFAVLAGAAALLLILLVVFIVLCHHHRRRRRHNAIGNKRELRMLSIKQHESVSSEYEIMNVPSGPVPEPLPRTRHLSVSEAEGRLESSLLQPDDTADRQPSPVPKPRTKSPQTQN
ncbi:uncharacterized protein si:ch211-132g1.1 [Entelurus aequoreus]|uniref:uncharacterized protein si:ch211-132g1.1 n=1 Tax=Entelurus aequoreus TaxID=161455 RepID=UPI002B1E465B|nr:uncharacterized protein si:ch211-132g1.1 [Entelurus aequoreus]